MDNTECNYVRVISILNGNIYSEIYQCEVTGKYLNCSQCNLSEEQKYNLFLGREERLKEWL